MKQLIINKNSLSKINKLWLLKKLAPKAKVKAPAKIKKDEPIVKTIMVPKKVIDWNRVKSGMYFTAEICGKETSGIIYKLSNNSYYLCQNNADGSNSPNKYGYKYSWHFSPISMESDDVENLDFPPLPKGFVPPVIVPEIAGYVPVINKGYVQFGCKRVSNKDVRFLVKHLKD